jgi:hypothetical protein
MKAEAFTHTASHAGVYQSGVAMQQHTDTTGVYAQAEPGKFNAAIDPKILARLDTGLLKCLLKLGTPRQRICSALCLSYSEYDEVVELLQTPR